MSLLETLTAAILPFFAMIALGYGAGRTGIFDRAAAFGVNRFVFMVGAPALIASVIIVAPIDQFQWPVLAVYLATEAVIYLTAVFFGVFVFRLSALNSLVLGMAAAFANHVFYVLPIARTLYGDAVDLPIGAMIAVDICVALGVSVLALEMLTAEGSVWRGALRFFRNPNLIAIWIALAVNLSGVGVHAGIVNFLGFAGATAAPCALFSLGVVLSAAPLTPNAPVVTAVVLKTVAHPMLMAMALALTAVEPGAWPRIALLVTAAPCGAMPFVLAMQYGLDTRIAAQAIIWSTLASLLTLGALA